MILRVLFVCGLVLCASFGHSLAQSGISDSTIVLDTTRFERIFVIGLQGDLADGLRFLDSFDEASLTPRQQDIRRKYYTRFRHGSELNAHLTDDADVIRLMELYHNYWRRALLDNKQIPLYDSLLADSVSALLIAQDPTYAAKTYDELWDNFTQYLSEFLQKRGIYSATGKTGLLFDLLLHARETASSYGVTTPEDTVQVTVIFMDSTISNGWEEYATFGRYFPGGWATDEALYCAGETYDTSSENFTISYVKHEGKHFADYKRFPRLTGVDLEYRAKLVELSYANASMYELIRIFALNSSTDRQNPHAFANHCVLRDLSAACELMGDIANIESWRSIPLATIQSNARELLFRHTQNLLMAGAETVTEFIH